MNETLLGTYLLKFLGYAAPALLWAGFGWWAARQSVEESAKWARFLVVGILVLCALLAIRATERAAWVHECANEAGMTEESCTQAWYDMKAEEREERRQAW